MAHFDGLFGSGSDGSNPAVGAGSSSFGDLLSDPTMLVALQMLANGSQKRLLTDPRGQFDGIIPLLLAATKQKNEADVNKKLGALNPEADIAKMLGQTGTPMPGASSAAPSPAGQRVGGLGGLGGFPLSNFDAPANGVGETGAPMGGMASMVGQPMPNLPNTTPSSGDDDLAIRTIAAETSGDPKETVGIAHVINNRIASGKWGDTAKDVVLAKNQFEPWNPNSGNDPSAIDPNSDRYKQAAAAWNAVKSGDAPDITNGSTHFYAPGAQKALGRNDPKWAQGQEGIRLGATAFYAPEGRVNAGARALAGAGPQPDADGGLHFSGDFSQYDAFMKASNAGKNAIWDGPPPSGKPVYQQAKTAPNQVASIDPTFMPSPATPNKALDDRMRPGLGLSRLPDAAVMPADQARAPAPGLPAGALSPTQSLTTPGIQPNAAPSSPAMTLAQAMSAKPPAGAPAGFSTDQAPSVAPAPVTAPQVPPATGNSGLDQMRKEAAVKAMAYGKVLNAYAAAKQPPPETAKANYEAAMKLLQPTEIETTLMAAGIPKGSPEWNRALQKKAGIGPTEFQETMQQAGIDPGTPEAQQYARMYLDNKVGNGQNDAVKALKARQQLVQQGASEADLTLFDRKAGFEDKGDKSETNDTKNYAAYVKDSTPRGQTPVSFLDYTQQMKKAGAINNVVDMKGESAQSQEAGKLVGASLTKPVTSLIDGVEPAHQKLVALNAMEEATKNPNLYTGAFGEQKQTLNKILQGVGQVFGIQPNDVDASANSAGETLEKFGRQLAGAQAKSVGGARVTNFELDQFIKANPGISMTPQGNQRLIGIMKQMAQREAELGQMAQDYAADKGAKSNISEFRKTYIDDYDKKNPILDPITGKKLSSGTKVGDLDSGGPSGTTSGGLKWQLN